MSSSKKVLSFDERIYHVEAIQKAAYRYINIFCIDLSYSGQSIECIITFDKAVTNDGAEYYTSEFKKEILDQQLRKIIKEETEPVRNLILGIAFSNTDLHTNE
ncbi:His-Xaa-Ser system protein HxsD [Methylobacillus glycogenes]|uniref:His-Xaa-Ser system protein HxsD n=1 Tax=Methylobacillus glycogenes TaxID=406 RepID=UPI00046FC483|nr:His-Xaa-Ser system protein HxsD [Methylobacillus glycogenes]